MMFAAPPEQSLEWSDQGVQGAYRFIRRLWKSVYEHVAAGPAPGSIPVDSLSGEQRTLRRQVHQTLVKVTDDIGRRRVFNTAVAAVMELMNALDKFTDGTDTGRAIRQEALENVVLLLSPIVPHICHALWQELGHEGAIIDVRWPEPDAAALAQDSVEIVLQVNGKLRGRIVVPAGASETDVREAALADAAVLRWVEGKPIRKVIVVPGKLVNVVA
jgi:leucyl-tRNA synthetase